MKRYQTLFPGPTAVCRTALFVVAILFGIAFFTKPASLQAFDPPPLVVNSMADTGNGVCDTAECTLREAILAANESLGLDEIVVPAGVYMLGLMGAGEDDAYTGDLDITDDVVIRGDTAVTTIIDANEIDRVFHIMGNVEARLQNLTIQNGFAGDGGGIFNRGTLYIVNSAIISNRVNYDAPEEGWNTGGGIFNIGTIYMDGSSVIGNRTDQSMGDGPGGGILNGGILLANESEFRSNWAAGGGAIFNGHGKVVLTACLLENNNARFFGGALQNFYEGDVTISRSTITGNNESIYNADASTLLLINSTVSGNTAFRTMGGIMNWGGTAKIIHSTITNNATNSGYWPGGISGSVILSRSIVAHNMGGDCSTAVVSRGYNLDSDGSCGLNETSDLTADPLLGPLQDNGGPTATHALLPGSPAIDHIPTRLCPATLDQRGLPRPADGNGDGLLACDVGAYEVNP